MESDAPPLILRAAANWREVRSSPLYSWDCAPGSRAPQHHNPQHAFVILQWTHSGRGALEVAGQMRAVTAGEAFVVLVPERLTYSYPLGAGEPWVFSWVDWHGELVVDLARRFRAAFGPVASLPPGSPAALTLASIIQTVARRSPLDPYEASEVAYRFWMQWWKQLDQPGPGVVEVIRNVADYAERHFREPLTVAQLADRAGLSREHFTREFHRHTGQSPGRFLRHRRVDAAAELLRLTNWSLADVALRSGFASTRQCAASFRAERDVSPALFRQSTQTNHHKEETDG